MNALVPQSNVEAYKASTDAASLCKEIVVASAMEIQRRKYVRVEGWQAIAIAHGCVASARDVERIEGGVRAIGEVRRMSDGQLVAQAEGFVGEDEPTWYGGEAVTQWGKKTLPKRPDYAIRAMAQTRAVSRACRSAFAHVVVMMNAGLSTTPAEEVPLGGFDDRDDAPHVQNPQRAPAAPQGSASGVKRLTSARAKEIELHKALKDKVEATETEGDVDELERTFDDWTAQAPLSWLDSLRNMLILRREDITRPTGDDELDAEFKAVVGA